MEARPFSVISFLDQLRIKSLDESAGAAGNQL